MKKILIPTDFSNCAEAAAEVGLSIAQKTGASVTFMHLCVTPVDWVKLNIGQEKQYPEIIKQIGHAKFQLNKWVSRADKLGLDSERILAFTQDENTIINQARDYQYDLIVMGSNGASGFREKVMGSKTQYLVQHSKTPVLVIKEGMTDFAIRRLVFASTFEADAHDAFYKISMFANLLGAHVQLLYINEPEHFETTKSSLNRIQNFLGKISKISNCINIYNAETTESGILEFAEDNSIDLIAMATHGRQGFKGLFMETLTEKIVNHSSLPVLSVNLQS